ncbi:hypothetical protein ACHAWF_007633 [Thalassiosira exigua]
MSSLKQRLSAYQDSSSSTARREEPKRASLKCCKAAYEWSASSTQQSPPLSLKERMSTFEGASSTSLESATTAFSSSKSEPTLKSRMSAFQPPGENSIQDRMAKFESSSEEAKVKPKKKQTDFQKRMSVFAEASSPAPPAVVPSAKKTTPKAKVAPKPAHGAGLRDRMAKYKDTASPNSEPGDFSLMIKKKPPAKRKIFKAKKPGGSDMQERMAKFVEASSTPGGAEAKHPAVVSPAGIVAKNAERAEREIKRNEERLVREIEIKQIQEELRNEAAIKSAERRKQLEEQLKAAEAAVEALAMEEAAESHEDGRDVEPANIYDNSQPSSPEAVEDEKSLSEERRSVAGQETGKPCESETPAAKGFEEKDAPITSGDHVSDVEQAVKSLEKKRRAELQSLMRDKSLKKDERKRAMEEVKSKYGVLVKDSREGRFVTPEKAVGAAAASTVAKDVKQSASDAENILKGKEREEVHEQNSIAKVTEPSSPTCLERGLSQEGTISPNNPRSDLQRRMAAFKEASSPDAFQKRKLTEEGDEIHDAVKPGNDLEERMAKFKEVSSPDAFQIKKNLSQENASPTHSSNETPIDLKHKLSAFVEASSPDAFQKKRLDAELQTESPVAASPFNPQEGESPGQPHFGRVVEHKISPVVAGPKDYDYLYSLHQNLDQLKLQEYDSPHLKNVLLFDEVIDANKQNEKQDIKASLEAIIGSKTHYTAKADWLNKEWVNEHLIRDGKYNSLKFQFRDHRLFQRFDKTCQKSRDNIIRVFVNQLLSHAGDITQLDLANCLLPDKFLQVLAEEVLKSPATSFPRLQLLNLESNLLQGPGIEALSEVIANDNAWKFLQAVMLENQKHSMAGEAEKALANAVRHSASIVVCSVSIRCPYQLKDINDQLLYNMDQLRLARRDHQAKEGTLKERKRTEMELFFDSIAANDSSIIEVELVGDQKFLTLDEEEKAKSGAAFATNTSIQNVKMELLGLGDSFGAAFGESIAHNCTIKKVNIDCNSLSGVGIKALFSGLGQNSSIEEFQVRHQQKVMASLDEDALPDLIASNTTILKLGVDIRNQLVRMRLDKIINANRDRLRKLRAESKHYARQKGYCLTTRRFVQ